MDQKYLIPRSSSPFSRESELHQVVAELTIFRSCDKHIGSLGTQPWVASVLKNLRNVNP